jgi:DNA-binding Lrp family transcriptional regulator
MGDRDLGGGVRSMERLEFDSLDKVILDEIQRDLPVCQRPFQKLSQRIGISEDELILRVRRLKRLGVIRRLGASTNSRMLGFASTLVGMKVSIKYLEKVVSTINAMKGVTHNYKREGNWNVWFTLTARSRKELDEVIDVIKKQNGVEEFLEFPVAKIFKVDFKVEVR